jgi:hypothetical protein
MASLIRGKQISTGSNGIKAVNVDTSEIPTLAANNTFTGTNIFNTAAVTVSGTATLTVPTPTSGGHAVNKTYLDQRLNGLDWKESVRVATTANVDLSSMPAIVDGVTLASGNRFLAKDQTTASENGIYIFNGNGSAATRATDADENAEVTANLAVMASEGTANGDIGFTLTTNDPIVVGTTALTFVQFSSMANVTAGDGLSRTGNELDVVTDDATLTINGGVTSGGAVKIKDLGVGTTQLAANAVTTAKILDSNVTSAKLATDAVITIKIADNNVTTAKIADANVTDVKLATDSVTTAKIAALNVTAAKLAVDSVTTTKIADLNVTTAKINDDAVTTVKILDSNVTANKLAADSVTTAKILDSNVTANKLATDSVTTAKIVDLNVTTLKINDAAVTPAKLATSVAGNGLTGGGGSALSVVANGDSISVSGSGVKAAVFNTGNRNMTASVTTADNQVACATTLAVTPAGDGGINVYVNGLLYEVGNGVKTKDCYFSDDGGTNAKSYALAASGDTLYWVGSVAGFQLDATDRITFEHAAIV